jgi:Yip1 domain
MNIISIPKMVASSQEGWLDLEKFHPSLVKLFSYIVFPLSLLPPAMLYYAGTNYGDEVVAGFGGKPWAVIAAVFFLAEMVTFFAMGWLIRQVAENQNVKISAHDAYMLAGVAPIPLWLSSLALLIPSLMFNVAVSLLALALSFSLVYHGVYALCHMREEVTAAGITQTVMGVGFAAWALLMVIIISI